MPLTSWIHEFLQAAGAVYSVIPHRRAYTAQEEAAATHVPGREFAKVVICFVDGHPIQAVVPAPLTVDVDRLLELAGGRRIRVAEEKELQRLFPDCEVGAMPPLGPFYDQPVFVDVTLAAQPEIAFNAGTHTEAIYMRWADFARAIRPIVGVFAERPAVPVGVFRMPLGA
jgi:Ala-tRNA(Pro) deacylase